MVINLKSRIRIIINTDQSESAHISRSMILISLSLLFAKFISAAKEVLVANRYGTSPILDGYLFAFNLSQWPSSVFASVTGIIIIPYLVKIQKDKPAEADKLRTALLSLAFFVGIATSVLYGAIMWCILGQINLDLSEQSKSAISTALPFIAPGIALTFVSSMFSNWLMSQRRHTNSILEAVPAAFLAVSLLIWPIAKGQGWPVYPLAIGTLLGFGLQTLLLIKASGRGFGFVRLGDMRRHWLALRSPLGIMMLAQVIMTSTDLLNQFLAVRMGEGVLASYSYAERLMVLLLGLTAAVVSRSMLPVLSGIDNLRTSLDLAFTWARRLAFLGTIITLMLIFVSEFLVYFIFQRGAFTEKDTNDVAKILSILGFQIPFYLPSIVLVQWLSASRNTSWLLLAAIGGLIAKILGIFIWFDLGAVGLSLSTTLMYCTTTIIILLSTKFITKNRSKS